MSETQTREPISAKETMRQRRLQKLTEHMDKGINPYPYKYNKDIDAKTLQEKYKNLPAGEETEDFYSVDWEHMNIRRPNHINAKYRLDKPKHLDEMLELSKKLSNNIPFCRTDFYEINGRIFFGEITLFPASGWKGFIPDDVEGLFGEWITLPG